LGVGTGVISNISGNISPSLASPVTAARRMGLDQLRQGALSLMQEGRALSREVAAMDSLLPSSNEIRTNPMSETVRHLLFTDRLREMIRVNQGILRDTSSNVSPEARRLAERKINEAQTYLTGTATRDQLVSTIRHIEATGEGTLSGSLNELFSAIPNLGQVSSTATRLQAGGTDAIATEGPGATGPDAAANPYTGRPLRELRQLQRGFMRTRGKGFTREQAIQLRDAVAAAEAAAKAE
jgi:hypothetical protein